MLLHSHFLNLSNPTTLFVLCIFYYVCFCHVFSKKKHNTNTSSGGVALAACVGGKFSDWFKILQVSKPIGDWQVPLNIV